MIQLGNIYSELKSWQTAIGSSLGFVALMVAAIWNFRLNRMRDAELREDEARSVAAALYGEILLLQLELARLARATANRFMNHGLDARSHPDFDRHFLEQHQLSEATLYQALASKIGLLNPDLVLAITGFHQRYRTAKIWLPMLVPNPERPFTYAVSYALLPAVEGVTEVQPALRKLEIYLGIKVPAAVPDLGSSKSALEIDSL